MKRLFTLGLGLGLVAAMAVPAAANGGDSYTLYADQNVPVGTVTLSSWPELKIELKDGWCMTQLHAHAATDPASIPQNKQNNPQIGQFEVNESFAKCKDGYTFQIPDTADDGRFPYFAVHLKVWDPASKDTKTIYSNGNTDVVAFNGVAEGPNPAVATYEPKGYPNCGPAAISPVSGSVWDDQMGSNSNDPGGKFDGATWIWRTAVPAFPEAGEYVTFKRELSNPGWRMGGTIWITADNGYRLFLDGDEIGSAQVQPGFPPKLSENYVKTTGWQTPEDFNVPQGTADLTMKVIAANEWMKGDPDGGPQNPTTGTPGVAGGLCPNPGGLLFKVNLNYRTDSETAWAEGTDFGGSSWATYFKYDPAS